MRGLRLRSFTDQDQYSGRNAGQGWRADQMAKRTRAGRTIDMTMADHSHCHRHHRCDEHNRNYHAPDSALVRHFGCALLGALKRLRNSVVESLRLWILKSRSQTFLRHSTGFRLRTRAFHPLAGKKGDITSCPIQNKRATDLCPAQGAWVSSHEYQPDPF